MTGAAYFTPADSYLRGNTDVLNWATGIARERGIEPGRQFQDTVRQLGSQHWIDYGKGEGREWGRPGFSSGSGNWTPGPETPEPTGVFDIQTAKQFAGGNPYENFGNSLSGNSGGGNSGGNTVTQMPMGQARPEPSNKMDRQPSFGQSQSYGGWGQFLGGLLGGMQTGGLLGGMQSYQQPAFPAFQQGWGQPYQQSYGQPSYGGPPPSTSYGGPPANTGHNMLWSL